jgi:8-oxo-dGTP diphosphatase
VTSGNEGATAPVPDPAAGSAGGAARMIPSTLVYVRRDGATLMLRKARGHQRGLWNGLGGKAEPGEMPEACARREVREEAGLEVDHLDYRGLIVFPRFDGTNDWYVWIYLATAHGEPRDGDEGELAWTPNDRLADLELHEGDRVFLPWLDRRELVFSARFDYEEGRFLGHEVAFYPRG